MVVYAENEIEDDKMKEEYVHNMPDFINKNLLKEIRDEKYVAVVYIVAHSSLPYNPKSQMAVLGTPFDIYSLPPTIGFHKITASNNGQVNCINFDPKNVKEKLIDGIQHFYDAEKRDVSVLSNKIKEKLQELKKTKGFYITKEREILNKVLTPISLYKKSNLNTENTSPVQLVLHYTDIIFDENGDSGEGVVYNTLDLYPHIWAKYRMPNRIIPGKHEGIKTADIIKFLHEYLKIKNVVLIDLSCSSWGESNLPAGHESFISNLNHKNIRGGLKSLRNKKRKPFKVTRSKALSRRNRGTRKKA